MAHLPADFQYVAEALGRNQSDTRTFSFQYSIGGHSRAVHEAADGSRVNAPLRLRHLQCCQHGARGIIARGWQLGDADGAVRQPADDVGEGAADIDPDFNAHGD